MGRRGQGEGSILSERMAGTPLLSRSRAANERRFMGKLVGKYRKSSTRLFMSESKGRWQLAHNNHSKPTWSIG